MKYKINEIFYSVQTEGYFSGTPAVFIRFSGCNLRCPWCDTKTHNEGKFYTKQQIEKKVEELTKGNKNIIIVFTGGEPTIQLNNEEELLENHFRTIETNGILPPPEWINWVTCSPKTNIDFENKKLPNEIKLVYEEKRKKYFNYLKSFSCIKKYIQPLEKNGKMNIKKTINFIKKNPEFKLSLQYHKIIGIR